MPHLTVVPDEPQPEEPDRTLVVVPDAPLPPGMPSFEEMLADITEFQERNRAAVDELMANLRGGGIR